jgi:predicted kinase
MTLSSRAQRERVRALAREAGAELKLIWVDCPIEVAIARIETQSDHPAADRDARLVREVAARFETPEDDAIRLDAKLDARELARMALEKL